MAIRKLEMVFKNALDSTSKLSIDYAKADITKNQIETAMQSIIDKNIFNTSKGELVSIDSARIVTTDIEEIV